eukprot:CAMPEP_0113647324 /NCGR_PEP_ID=MMETSP0017_2-20120614/25045_1 /TAXON_ID=2856 /ORGANISM="Cylindrotheca closterium" /LENGTH=364 /DNA_ID=CAMNT_0000559363 /DNA_START=259 /DNA_END=1353 /DNA_ORIENTATION=- /assembly_acc=CAM_ASM_000147
MCQDPNTKLSSKSPRGSPNTGKETSPLLSTSSSVSDGDWSRTTPVPRYAKRMFSLESSEFDEPSSVTPPFKFWPTTFGALALSFGMLGFSLWMPFVGLKEAAGETYQFAYWNYDPSISSFDNTAWTYVTDYMLAAIMAAFTMSTLSLSQRRNTDRLCNRVASLSLLYMISVIAGGIAHQTFLTVESRNSLSFQLLWTLCVGTVSLASTSMGCCGSEIVRKFQAERHCSAAFQKIPLIPEYVWCIYGSCVFAFTALGGMSFQRPACDIFIAGTTQTPTTAYIMIVLFFLDHPKAKFNIRALGMFGFIFNAPLLPLYPILIYYTDLSLAAVNTLLHGWLTVAWSLQAFSLGHVIRSVMYTAKENSM